MAMIPKKTKITNSDEFFGLDYQTFITVVGIFFFTSYFFSKYIHERMQIFFLVFVIMISIYLLFPSSKNKGHNGIQRIMIMLKYEKYRFEERKLRKWK